MPSITAGAASNKISELRSKLAIYRNWVETLRANYMPSDGGRAEAQILRDDGGTCSEAHFHAVIEDIEEKAAEVQEELAQWEGLVFEPAKAQVTPITQPPLVTNDGQAKRPERSKFGARRIQPAAKQP